MAREGAVMEEDDLTGGHHLPGRGRGEREGWAGGFPGGLAGWAGFGPVGWFTPFFLFFLFLFLFSCFLFDFDPF